MSKLDLKDITSLRALVLEKYTELSNFLTRKNAMEVILKNNDVSFENHSELTKELEDRINYYHDLFYKLADM